MKETNPAKLILLFGATGRTGFHIAHKLLQHGFAVRIVVRSKSKVTELYKEKQIAFQKIIEGQINIQTTLKQAFEDSNIFGKVSYAISALGAGFKNQDSIQQIEYLNQVRIIQKCKQFSIQKYVLITGVMVQRPWNLIALCLNTFIPNVIHWKMKAQNYLRNSGLNYAIVRPTGLAGDQKDCMTTAFKIGQMKYWNGVIPRCTVASIILNVIQAKQIPNKVTFQCTVGTQQIKSENYANLRADDKNSIVQVNHKTPKIIFWGLFFMTILILFKLIL